MTDTASRIEIEDTDAILEELQSWLQDNWDPEITVREWWERLGTSGWAAPTWPTDAFGKGLSRDSGVRVQQAIAEFGALPAPGGLGLLLAGQARSGHWSEPRGRAADAFDMKGALELLMRRLGRSDFGLVRPDDLPPHLHPGQGALAEVAGEVIGAYGSLHPDVREALELPAGVVVAELSLEPLVEAKASAIRVEPLDRFPAVDRDLSVVCDASQPAAALEPARTAVADTDADTDSDSADE